MRSSAVLLFKSYCHKHVFKATAAIQYLNKFKLETVDIVYTTRDVNDSPLEWRVWIL